jgi:uncharacterized membrane protein
MSAPVFRLKGGGWYETDFKGDQDQKKNLADRPEADAPKDEKAPVVDAKADASKDAAKPAETAAEKPAVKAPAAETPKKAAGGTISKRGSTAAPIKPKRKPAAKKAAAKSKRRA